LIAISPQLESYNRAVKEEKKLSLEILSDPGNQVAKVYGIAYTLAEDLKAVYLKFNVDVPAYNGDDSWTLPMPARLIVDQSGLIRYAEISPDYTVRPDPQETLEALGSLPVRP
jgi:peroxiredoxin